MAPQKNKKGNRRVFVATWNVCSLVESSGDVRICRRGNYPRVDRGLDFLTSEFEQHRVAIAGAQETKWFGSDIWPAGKGLFLHSGRPVPRDGETARRNEGVGIWLNADMADAWKRGGEQWVAVSSRIVSARLLLSAAGEKLARGGKRRSDLFITVVNAYAPTNKAPVTVKENFFQDLQTTLDKRQKNDLLLLLGDFNARVGSCASEDGAENVVGRFGLGQRNQAGEKLIQFCSTNNLSIMNTWFRKRRTRRGTWTHPATRQSHLIDYIVMLQNQRAFCSDVRVMRGPASVWSDHFMVRATLWLGLSKPRRTRSFPHGFAVNSLRDQEVLQTFQSRLDDQLAAQELPDYLDSDPQQRVEAVWSVIKETLKSTASDVLGPRQRIQPDWFLENQATLTPVLEEQRRLRQAMLSRDSRANRKAFRRAQRAVAKAVRAAKDNWVRKTSEEAEEAKKNGRVRWTCIRKLQGIHAGRKPATPSVLLDENNILLTTSAGRRDRWAQHFGRVLNVQSKFDENVIMDMVPRDVRHDLDDTPTLEEVKLAINTLKSDKAGGSTGLVPELIKSGGMSLHTRLHCLMVFIWSTGRVPADWRNAEIVPIPKKGDLRSCDNWRGISLLDVVGKVLARIVQDRLASLADQVLPESQCGFRKGRGCVDMIFAARQMIEKSIEHHSDLYILFVDLKKAYDSVPRTALWPALTKLGVPPRMLQVIRALHDGMLAHVRVDGSVTDEFVVTNGLRQGCTLAPMLFNLYFAAVMTHWHSTASTPGIPVLYRMGRRLVGDRTTKSRLQSMLVSASQFADDVALYTTTRDNLEIMATEFTASAARWGLTVSVQKTKAMAVGESVDRHDVCLPNGNTIESVQQFTYLGSNLDDHGSLDEEVSVRLRKAAQVYGCLHDAVFGNPALSLATKRHVYQATVLMVLFYGSETWTVKACHLRRLSSFHNHCIRRILGVSRREQWAERLSTIDLAQRFGMPCGIADQLRDHRLRWLGHMGRMQDHRLPKQLLFGERTATRPRHGPKKRWRDLAIADLQGVGIAERQWLQLAQDRARWHQACSQLANTLPPPPTTPLLCTCGRTFRRSGDLKRHKPFCRHTSP